MNGFTSSDLSVNCQLAKRDQNFMAFCDELRAYVQEQPLKVKVVIM